MLKLLKFKKTYILIPILGIFFSIIISIFSHRTRLNISLLEDYDVTGMTGIYLKFITAINIIVLLVDLYMVIRTKEKGYPYIFNKIFSIIFLWLAIITMIAFIGIRKNEEKISVQFKNGFFQESENIILAIKSNKETKLDMLEKYQADEFYYQKLKIADEVEKIKPDLRRYIQIITPFFGGNIGYFERSYYSILIKFVILDLILSYVFFYHIKDEIKERKTRFE